MKNIVTTLLLVCAILLTLIFGANSYIQSKVVKHPFKDKSTQIEVTVNKGDSINSIIDNLNEKGKINNLFWLKFYIRGKKIDPSSVKPGTETISSDATLDQLIEFIKSDKKKNIVKVTFPEGFSIVQIADRLNKNGLISKEDFISACKNYKLPEYIKVDSKRRYALEGFLFPDTYEFKKGMSGDEIITTMLERFEYVINDTGEKKSKVINATDVDKLVNMAALVEREAQAKDERAIVASVFYNRLKKNMKLESCATVNYAMDKVINVLSIKDTQFISPYNTYLNPGLPIGPICCPGRAAIEAALIPDKTDYLFFVANMKKADGTMIFAKTLAEHNANVKKYEK